MSELNRFKEMALASTCQFFLEGMKRILADEEGIKVVGEASNATEVKKLLKNLRPEFLFMDNRTLKLDILYQINFLQDKNFDTKVILFNLIDGYHPISPRLIYIKREADTAELMAMIKENSFNNGFPGEKDEVSGHKLSLRQGEVLELVKAGLSNKEIAKKLTISERTVKANLTKIFTKLNIQSRYQLMVYARRQTLNGYPSREHRMTHYSHEEA